MKTARYNKFGNHKTEVGGIVFDSGREANRYLELKLLQRGGAISNLELQPKFVLQEPFTRGTVKYRAITYVADFRYIENGAEVVEDAKGYATPEYLLKKKLLLAKWPDMDFREV